MTYMISILNASLFVANSSDPASMVETAGNDGDELLRAISRNIESRLEYFWGHVCATIWWLCERPYVK